MIWIREVEERRNHSLSASNIARKETSGKSIHSLNKLTHTIISISQVLSFFRISQRSIVTISLCK
ncbi:MAG: hypothetical protein BWY04_00197 [candidate division CPR1 bacterium ADurb.Bin160]|uniref:Uncharacterized protein n=1 Tax=candidate division CPR1 bacterium ADurb.Bin160 TaxID=1852826 RepID=A0A1V5ZQN5_9BACT|nr:MAG: hypothetical protein BWY04_00197 [candidate division CPR1 bacterium ADurb.Bin160]